MLYIKHHELTMNNLSFINLGQQFSTFLTPGAHDFSIFFLIFVIYFYLQ